MLPFISRERDLLMRSQLWLFVANGWPETSLTDFEALLRSRVLLGILDVHLTAVVAAGGVAKAPVCVGVWVGALNVYPPPRANLHFAYSSLKVFVALCVLFVQVV